MKKKIAMWQIVSGIAYLGAIAWNIKAGGTYDLELAIGFIALAFIKIWEDYLK